MLTAHLTQKLSELLPKDTPFAIAFSGGGDSTALVHALKDHPHAKYVYIVDHDLREGSGDEALAAQKFAQSFGYTALILKWRHDAPSTGVQEKARRARYALMAHHCREAGVNYLLTGHTEDDQAETVMMRFDRKTDWRGAAGMAATNYGALWPDMALVTLVRPLLDISRQELRDYNTEHGLSWSEDPSNQNLDYTRIQARQYLMAHPDSRAELLATCAEMRGYVNEEKAFLREQFAVMGAIDENGIITLSDFPVPELLYHCLRCAGGQGGLINRNKLRHMLHKMRDQPVFKSATLHGAMVAKYKKGFMICRDPIAVKGRQDSRHDRAEIRKRLRFKLSSAPRIWDGRFMVTGPHSRCYMGSVYHDSKLLTEEQRSALKRVPAPALPTLPVSKQENSILMIGSGGSEGIRTVKPLVKARLEAALGGKLS